MKNYFWFILSLLWAGLILYLSFFNPISLDPVEPWFKNQDKVGHFFFYAVLSMILIKTFSQEIILQNPIGIGALLAFFLGVFIELAQHFLTRYRDGNFEDTLANGLGILLMVILINRYPKIFHTKLKT